MCSVHCLCGDTYFKGKVVNLGMANTKKSGKYKLTTTNLPGMKGIPVIVTRPMIVKENSSKPKK
jgi:hypothetical protein